jgi:hypothetical protein
MPHRACMQHLLCTRMPVRSGVTDGAIDATSAAVGKISDIWGFKRYSPLDPALRPEASSTRRGMGVHLPALPRRGSESNRA